MKTRIGLFTSLIFLLLNCQKDTLYPTQGRASYTINGKQRQAAYVTVTRGATYLSTYPNSNQYQVLGRIKPTKNNQEDELLVFHFIEQNDKFFLHAVGLNSKTELGGWYGMDLKDSLFANSVTADWERNENKVKCTYDITFMKADGSRAYLTNGTLEFDLSGVK